MKQKQTQTLEDHFKNLQSLLKPVEKVNIADLIPGIKSNPQQECAIIVTENDGSKKIVNVCSPQYELLPNREIIEPLLETFGDRNISIVSQQRLDARFSLDIIFNDFEAKIQGKDPIKAKLKLHNSYDGRAKCQFHMGFFRMICSNGMVIPLEGYGDKNISMKMRHTPKLGTRVDSEKLLDMVQEFGENMLYFEKPFEELAQKKLSEAELPELLTMVVGKTKFPTRQLEDVIDRLNFEMIEMKAANPNNWLVYNSFNYQLNHSEDINMDPAKKEQLDQDIFSLLLNN